MVQAQEQKLILEAGDKIEPPSIHGTTRCPECGSYPKQRKRGYCPWCDSHGSYR
jgi:hypothetical protein